MSALGKEEEEEVKERDERPTSCWAEELLRRTLRPLCVCPGDEVDAKQFDMLSTEVVVDFARAVLQQGLISGKAAKQLKKSLQFLHR